MVAICGIGSRRLTQVVACRYVPQLSGVLITHTPTRFLQDTAVFSADSAFATASVGFECVVWRPKIGQVLGKLLYHPNQHGSYLPGLPSQREQYACRRHLTCLCSCTGYSMLPSQPHICRKKITSSFSATQTQQKARPTKVSDTGASDLTAPNWAASMASCPSPLSGMFNCPCLHYNCVLNPPALPQSYNCKPHALVARILTLRSVQGAAADV